MKKFTVLVKPNSKSTKVLEWTRYAADFEQAAISATKAVNETYYGEGCIVAICEV